MPSPASRADTHEAQALITQWEQWAHEPTDPEENRLEALDRLLKSLRTPAELETKINLSGLGLKQLPELPPHASSLNICRNRLRHVPGLPAQLRVLITGHNPLTELPVLPQHLHTLSCSHAQLRTMPKLPASIRRVLLHHNQITEFVDQLPVRPAFLDLSYNHVIDLHPRLFSGPCSSLLLAGNPLSEAVTAQAIQRMNAANYTGPQLDFTTAEAG